MFTHEAHARDEPGVLEEGGQTGASAPLLGHPGNPVVAVVTFPACARPSLLRSNAAAAPLLLNLTV
ncbi:MAG: hypothetical protein U1D25_05580 [Hydrogenophaga sp.]|uniref:hypothetical protein n=1 Tax=Hydrogenophaga sp. TaxID=1904254 RepID=UPI002753CC72|nr:hypothetical protein [Hydrogenophaga sp.]MDP2419314.1 hypothetical protein [Hydrogenophaga sp.]MDZ4187567.1 hypothetical protein [Hydrogenophaga sp.]